MTTTIEPWVNLLIQVPLVGIFVWFTLTIMARFQDAQEKRDTAFLAAQKERDVTFLNAQKERDTSWQEFLKEQRAASNQVLGQVVTEIKQVAAELNAVKGMIMVHDQRVEASIPEMRRAVRNMKRGQGDQGHEHE